MEIRSWKLNMTRRKWKLSPKLFCILICLFLVPTIFVSFIFIGLIRQDVLSVASDLYADSLHRNSDYIDDYIDQLRINSQTLTVNNAIRSFFLMHERPSNYSDYKMLRDTYSELQYCVELSEGIIQNIYIYNMTTQLFRATTQEYAYRDLGMQDHPDWEKMFRHEFSLFHDCDLVETITGNRNATLAIKSAIFNGIDRGFIAIELNPATLNNLFRLERDSLGISFFLADREGSVVISQPTDMLASQLIKMNQLFRERSISQINIEGIDYLCTYHSSAVLEEFGYYLFIPIKNLEHDVTAHISYYSFIMASILLLLIVASAGLTSVGIYTPIVQLKNLLSGKDRTNDVPRSMLDKNTMSDMRQMIANMHSQIRLATDTIEDIRTENEFLRGDLSNKERAYADLTVHKILNQESLTSEELQYLLKDVPLEICHMFCVTILHCDGGLDPIGEIQFLMDMGDEAPAHTVCKFLCATHSELYFLICTKDEETWKNRNEKAYIDFFEKIIENAPKTCGDIYAAMGDLTQEAPNAIAENLASAREKLRYKYMLPQSCILTNIGTKEFLMPIQYEILRGFENALFENRPGDALVIMKDYDRCLSRQHVSPKLCLIFQQIILYMLLNYLFSTGGNQGMTEDIYERMIHFDGYFRNYAEANDYICQCLDSLQKAEDQIVQQNYAIQAMELLENTGFQDVRLQEIANQLGVSEAHLSRQFKSTYGVNFK